mmetsp:Transcript_51585/g.164963  ORF Transcript_51585/g.164963 Transcript_51585/m.164963 type:complete len:128 (+) Transcript_51585:107-490(+)
MASSRPLRARAPVNYNEVKDGADGPVWLKPLISQPRKEKAAKKASPAASSDKENVENTAAPEAVTPAPAKEVAKKSKKQDAKDKGGKRKSEGKDGKPKADKRLKSGLKEQKQRSQKPAERVSGGRML